MNVELLVSEDTINLLGKILDFHIDFIGEISLKGKTNRVNVASVRLKNERSN